MAPNDAYMQITLQVHWATARPIQYIFLAESNSENRLRYVVPESRIVEELWDSGLTVEKITEGIETLMKGPRIWSLGVVPVRHEFLKKFHSY